MTFIRYVAVQLAAYAIDLGAFLLLVRDGPESAFFANVVAKVLAGTFAFFVHRMVTFRIQGGRWISSEAVRYGLLLLLNVPLTSFLLLGVLSVWPHAATAKIATDVMAIGFTYAMTRSLVFGRSLSRRSDARNEEGKG